MRFVEADNALGSARGDVDDGVALAALLGEIGADLVVGSTFGNTSEAEADRNNRALAAAAGVAVRHVRGSARRGQADSDAVGSLCDAGRDLRVLALGPLTTLAAALARKPDLAPAEVILVGGDLTSRGRWPPLWPHEFNFWLDRPAARLVFASHLPLTVVPIDLGRRLLLSRAFVASLRGPLGTFIGRHADRRLRRNRRWFGVDALRAYDLLAAAVWCVPSALRRQSMRLRLHRRGFLERGVGRDLQVVTEFDAEAIRTHLARAVARASPAAASVGVVPGADWHQD